MIMKDLPYTSEIVEKIIKALEDPTDLLKPSAEGTEFKTGYETRKKEELEIIKKIKF